MTAGALLFPLDALLYALYFGQPNLRLIGIVSGGKDSIALWMLAAIALATWSSASDASAAAAALLICAKVLLSFAYFVPGITKLLMGGWRWLDGVTFRAVLLERCYLVDAGRHGLRRRAAMAHRFGVVASLCGAGFECAFPLALVWPQLSVPLAAVATFFHLNVLVLMRISFFYYWAPTLWMMALPEALLAADDDASPPPSPPLSALLSSAPMCALVALFAAGVALYYVRMAQWRAEPSVWPFGVAPFYSTYAAGYPIDKSSGSVHVTVYVWLVGVDKAWQPPIDNYLARRLNADARLANIGSATSMSKLNALVERHVSLISDAAVLAGRALTDFERNSLTFVRFDADVHPSHGRIDNEQRQVLFAQV
jgi:hypothetical protein